MMSSIRAAWWLGVILVACWSSAAGLKVAPEVSGGGHGTASLARDARSTQPAALPRGLPRILASETHRQKLNRGHVGKSFGIVAEGVPLPLVAHRAFAPILCSGVLGSALVRAFEPRGPPSLIA